MRGKSKKRNKNKTTRERNSKQKKNREKKKGQHRITNTWIPKKKRIADGEERE
jgi:hypothetical protein